MEIDLEKLYLQVAEEKTFSPAFLEQITVGSEIQS